MSEVIKKKEKVQNWKPIINIHKKIKIPYLLAAAILAMGFIVSWFDIIAPGLIKKLTNGEINVLNIVTFAIAVIGGTIVSNGNVFIGSYYRFEVAKRTRNAAWDNILKVKPSYFDKEDASKELISRILNDSEVAGAFLLVIMNILPAITTTIGLLVVFKSYDTMLVYLVLLTSLVSILQVWIAGQIQFRFARGIRTKLAILTTKLADIVETIPVMKIFAKEKDAEQSGKEAIKEYRKVNVNFSMVYAGVSGLTTLINVASTLATIFVGIYLIKNHRIDIATFIAFAASQSTFKTSFIGIVTQWEGLKSSAGAINRLGVLFEEDKETLSDSLQKIQMNGDIVFKNVEFKYTDKAVLKDISFTIPKGKTTAIIGKSGSGKTTILNLLERLYEPTNGEILIGNQNIKNISPDTWRRSISYASQNKDAFNGTIRENLTYGINREVSEQELIDAATKSHAIAFINSKTDKFDSNVGTLGSALSGGEKQRLTLSREFLKNNDIMFFDEATASVDAESEYQIQSALKELLPGKTAVIVAHRLSTIKNADQIIILSEGQINGIGNHEELYNNNTIYKNLIDIDLKQKQN